MEKQFRVFKLRNESSENLAKKLEVLKKELSQLRCNKVVGGTNTKIGKIKVSLIVIYQ